MSDIAADLMGKHDSYITALKEAVDHWEKAQDVETKRDYIIAIGHIGHEVHRMNKALGMK